MRRAPLQFYGTGVSSMTFCNFFKLNAVTTSPRRQYPLGLAAYFASSQLSFNVALRSPQESENVTLLLDHDMFC
jgi:hypothetical protein